MPHIGAHNDPFDRVDLSGDPGFEEQILLERIDGPYYPAVLDWFFESLKLRAGDSSVLEVGCGTGQVLDRLAQATGQFTEVVGVDRSDYLAQRAAARFPSYDIRTANGAAMPFDDDSFDLSFTATVLVHAEDPSAILQEMARVTRKGGRVAVLDQDFGSAVVFPGDRDRTRRVMDAATDYWQEGWIGRKLPQLMREAGLDVTGYSGTVRVDRVFDRPFFERIGQWVVQGGVDSAEVDAWLAELDAGSATGDFVFTRNFYSCVGEVRA